MPNDRENLTQPVDAAAVGLARSLMRTARFGALATLDPESGRPLASRTATATDTDGTPVILVSALAPHTEALLADPRCSLLIGEPAKGDPLAHPRMTVACDAAQLMRNSEDGRRVRRRYLNRHPKAALYADFGDFSFFRLEVSAASLNAGFARAFVLDRSHLVLPPEVSALIAKVEQSVIDHMNEDHADTIRLLAESAESSPKQGWTLTGIDSEGIDLANGDIVRRLVFPTHLSTANDIKTALIELLRSKRGDHNRDF